MDLGGLRDTDAATDAATGAAALLAAEEAGVLEQRQAAVDAMLRLLAWCDLHSGDPQEQAGAVPVRLGGDRLVTLGGDGTPAVAELCLAEFAVAARAGVVATSNRAADALDLRHRLPLLHDAVLALRLDVWVARRVAALSRPLSRHRVGLVDHAVARAVDESPSRILAIAEAKVIEADVDAHRARIAQQESRTGVWLRRKRPGDRVDAIGGEADVQAVGMRLSTAGAMTLVETIDHLADALAAQHVPADEDDVPSADQLRARAAEVLADPAAAAALLAEAPEVSTGSTTGDGSASGDGSRRRRRRPATLYVSVHQSVLAGEVDGVARVDGLGPMLLEQVAALLRHREVTVRPVIDLNSGASVNAYEHPTACRTRTLLRTLGDVFPHTASATTTRGQLDHDHPTPYDPAGPPGQTGDHNDAPLTRRHHRAKTHAGHRARQLGPGAYRWQTPHGLVRVVTRRGTAVVEPLHTGDGQLLGEVYPARLPLRYQPLRC